MRFDSAAYNKLYPRTAPAVESVESAVETFTPTEEEAGEVSGPVDEPDTPKEGDE